MNVIQIGINSISSTILQIGFEGENEHTSVVFYWTPIYLNYPDAVATMKIKSPAGVIYPKTITQSGNKITWDVTASDCAAFGNGQYQLTFTDGEEVIKTYIGNFNVMASIVGDGTPPDPIADWEEEAAAALVELNGWNNATATATELTEGSDPTVSIDEVDAHKRFNFGIPAGKSGEMETVTVTGTTPSITGQNNKRYVCGEVSSITITAPETGMIDVIFTSGTTPAVLTATGITFPAWFDSTSLEASVTYEICIADGMGVVAKWA